MAYLRVTLLISLAVSTAGKTCPDGSVAGNVCTSDTDCNDRRTSNICAEGLCCASCRKLERQIRRQIVPGMSTGIFVPTCTYTGRRYSPQQCMYSNHLDWECWCVTELGREIQNTRAHRNNTLNCQNVRDPVMGSGGRQTVFMGQMNASPRPRNAEHCANGELARSIQCAGSEECPIGFECETEIGFCCRVHHTLCPDGNPVAPNAGHCSSNVDCPVDYECNLIINACCPNVIFVQEMCPGTNPVPPLEEPATCTENTECLSGFYCSLSVHGCCPRDNIFPRCSNGLTAIGMCFEGAMCMQGLFCENGHCCPHECTNGPALKMPGTNFGVQCDTPGDCPNNFVCQRNQRIPGIHRERSGHCCPGRPLPGPDVKETTSSPIRIASDMLCPDLKPAKSFCDDSGICTKGYSCVTTSNAVNVCCTSASVKGMDQCPETLVPLKEDNGDSKRCDPEEDEASGCPDGYICNFSIGTARYICCGKNSFLAACEYGSPLFEPGTLAPKRCNDTVSCPSTHVCSNKHQLCCPTKTTTCSSPMQTGNCGTYSEKYWYNSEANTCEPFVYSGCGGNDNRFDTNQDCFKTCTDTA